MQPPGNFLSSRCTRGRFISRIAMAALGGTFGSVKCLSSPSAAQEQQTLHLVKRWDVVTIGNLSRNRYWGEGDDKPVRSAICTCTVIQGSGFKLLVDPSLETAEAMTRDLDRRTGLKPAEIDTVFVTHEHSDHYAGLASFPKARWCAPHGTADVLNKTRRLPKPIEAVSGKLFDCIDITPAPGHTMSLHALRFDCGGLSVVIAGDAVATRDFWNERRGYYNCLDFGLSAKTMDKLAFLADIIVPGHDNYFQVAPTRRNSPR